MVQFRKIGSKVKDYKGVEIYVSMEGVFYADAKGNSPDFNQKTFHSDKMAAVESAIDGFMGEVKDGPEYYEIAPFALVLKKIKVVANVGRLLFFDDGTDSRRNRQGCLYSSEIEQTPQFIAIKSAIEKAAEIDKKISELRRERNAIVEEAKKQLGFILPVKPSL